MWEYKRKDCKFRTYAELTEYLNTEGNDSWEIISYTEEQPEKHGRDIQAKILFKRPKHLPA